MRFISKFSFIALLLFEFVGSAQAQFRKYSNEFLNIGAGAKSLGMGSVQVASVNDATAGYWNPAGLVHIKDNPSIAVMHAEYFAGIGKYDFGAIALPSKNGNRTLAISFLRFAVDDIPNTLFLVEPDGSINYNNISSFSSADYAVLLSYAQIAKQTDKLFISYGGNAKIIHRSVGSFAKAWGFGIDAGIQIKKDKWLFGATIRDVTTTFNAWSFTFTDREKEVLYLTNNDIPTKSTEMTAPRLIAAAARNFKINNTINLLAEANLHVTFDGKRNTLISTNPISIDPNIGIELGINNNIFLRAGASNFQRALKDGDTTNQKKVWIFQPSFGAGFKLGNVGIDYAFTNLTNQANPLYTHIFSLRIDLVKKEK
ncbi:MAG: PorV/PorQ family protein [Chitinophagaceae bacterium]|nr:PorV/PorQ family protein [Chitinophagaceae bacterium]MCW5904937.1 PorV/PorQ family protein [Chitinophagaceae bacterium]